MLQRIALIALAGVLAFSVLGMGVPPSKTSSANGSWQIDSERSEAQLISDAATDYGKTKINYTVGFTRVKGGLTLDDGDPEKSRIDFLMYPASSMSPPIGEDGKVKASWLAEFANHTLVCFHSKKLVRNADGKLQTTGDLTVTRVDRNIQLDPNEAYSGPTYGPPIIHRNTREASFTFDLAPGGDKNDSVLTASGSTSMSRENFPQLVRTVVQTTWPPVVMDEKCSNPAGGTEDYRGYRCTGTFMEASGLPPAPTQIGEDYPGPSDFNRIVGNQLSIQVRLRMTSKPSGQQAAGTF